MSRVEEDLEDQDSAANQDFSLAVCSWEDPNEC